MSTRVITAHIPTELADKVDHLAERFERPRGWVMKEALRNFIHDQEEKDRLTLEGMTDIRAGRTVPHDEVVAWAQSLGTDNPLPMPTPKDARTP